MEKFVQTISMVNYNNGVFSLYFIGQDVNKMSQTAEGNSELELKQVIHMPVTGFIHMVAMIKNMLENEKMDEQLEKLISIGFIPTINKNEEKIGK